MARRALSALVILLVAGLVGLELVAPPVSAHADFVSSTPSPFDIWNVDPTSVTVTVSEAVQPGTPAITVTNQSGVRVDTGPTRLSATDPTMFSVNLLPNLRPSVFTVTWSVVSADDGHFTAGTFYFMVSYRDGTLPGQFPQTGTAATTSSLAPPQAALEAVDFIGFSIVFGGTLLATLLWSPMASGLDPSERGGPAEGLEAILRLARIGALLLTAGAAGLLTENLLQSPPSTLAAAFSSVFQIAALARVVLGLVLAGLLTSTLSRRDMLRALGERPPELLPAVFLGFLNILVEVSASNSAASAAWRPLAAVADAAHLYGAALWVGGLLVLLRVRRWLREPTPPAFSHDLLAAFSRFALLGVVLVVTAGIVLAYVLVGSINTLVTTEYGWVILAKSSLLLPMVALGAWNRRTLHASGTSEKAETEGVRRLARNVRWEAVLGTGVLVLAGLLATMNPAATLAQSGGGTYTLDANNGGLYGIFSMNPWPETPGPYIFQLVVYYQGNETPYRAGGNATMAFLLEGGNGTAVTLPLEGPHGNHYFVDSGVLSVAGTWQIQAALRGPAGTPVELNYTVVLHP